jgi:hypothetical protein
MVNVVLGDNLVDLLVVALGKAHQRAQSSNLLSKSFVNKFVPSLLAAFTEVGPVKHKHVRQPYDQLVVAPPALDNHVVSPKTQRAKPVNVGRAAHYRRALIAAAGLAHTTLGQGQVVVGTRCVQTPFADCVAFSFFTHRPSIQNYDIMEGQCEIHDWDCDEVLQCNPPVYLCVCRKCGKKHSFYGKMPEPREKVLKRQARLKRLEVMESMIKSLATQIDKFGMPDADRFFQ